MLQTLVYLFKINVHARNAICKKCEEISKVHLQWLEISMSPLILTPDQIRCYTLEP